MRTLTRLAGLVALTTTALSLATLPASAHDPDTPEGKAAVEAFMADHEPAIRGSAVTGAAVPCVDGKAGQYPCKNVDLLSVLPLNQIGGGNGNDIWGWTDPSSGKEYAIMGRTNGTAFVDVSDPVNPKYLGNLPSHNGGSSTWRDMKVYKNHAFVVADAIRGHGMQVFDLTRLRSVTSPQTFTEDAHYDDFGPAHNIAINVDTGFAYAIGSNTCSGGPHMVNIQTPKSPTNAGCVSQDGYTHDNQCVTYQGPDTTYTGREICVNSNEDTVTIVDVTTKSAPKQLARKSYPGAVYTHQGWLTEDHRYFLLDDELDEQRSTDKRTKTYIWDLSDLDNPVHTGTYNAPVNSIDHNQYIKGDYSYQANYQSGLRILDVSDVGTAKLTETAFFDIYPSGNSASFNGAWSNYPYFDSGIVIISGIEQGLVVVKPNLDGSEPPPPAACSASNTDDVAIPDRATVTSTISFSNCSQSASATAKISVDIKHTYRGDLVIDLLAPDGTAYRLKNSGWDSADNVIETYTKDLSSESANGTWTLRVRDAYSGDTGRIDSWSLEL